MDVSGQDMTWVPSKGKVPLRVKVKRSIGQEKKCNVSASKHNKKQNWIKEGSKIGSKLYQLLNFIQISN